MASLVSSFSQTPPLVALILLSAMLGLIYSRRCQRSFNRPSVRESRVDSVSSQTKIERPLSDSFRDTIQSQDSISAGVLVLFKNSGPSAIFWRVGPVVVDAFNTMIWCWLSAHVSDECIEREAPPIAYVNAARSVVAVVGGSLIVTAALNRGPRHVFARFAHAVRALKLAIHHANFITVGVM